LKTLSALSRSSQARDCPIRQRPCFALSPLVIKVNGSLSRPQNENYGRHQDGTKAEDLQPRIFLNTTVVAEKNGRPRTVRLEFWRAEELRLFHACSVEETAKIAVNRTLTLFDAVQPPAGEVPSCSGRASPDPPARGDRARYGSRLQPEEDFDLQHDDPERKVAEVRL